jgi:hypothetical protein
MGCYTGPSRLDPNLVVIGVQSPHHPCSPSRWWLLLVAPPIRCPLHAPQSSDPPVSIGAPQFPLSPMQVVTP